MPRKARIHFVSLRSSLVNLPISIYGPLVERSIRPQQLVVHLTLVPDGTNKLQAGREEVYVGWTGMASASSLAQFNVGQNGERGLETIEIDPQYAQSLGLALNDTVEIGLLHDVPPAKSIGTEPVTSDDWEIIEIHAAHVESTLLSQVRVAKVGQEIDVWVLGRTRVRLRVTSLNPASKSNVLLLTTNTEVSIAPKPHRSKESTGSKIKPDGHQTRNGSRIANDDEKSSSESRRVISLVARVLPSRLAPDLKFCEHNGSELLAAVSTRTLIRLLGAEHIGDFPNSDNFYKMNFDKLTPPSDPSSSSTGSLPEPSTRILNPGAKREPESTSKVQSDPGEVYIRSSEQIPGGHIIYSALPEGLQEWDLVRLATVENGVSKSLMGTIPQNAPALSLQPSKFLAGVDQILERGVNYCIRELFIQSTSRSIHGAPGLLVTGRSGSGKTSIIRAIAQSLQDNPRTLTYLHYVDASKLSEQSISAVKAQFNFWFDTCAWHRPSILVLDELDKLLSTEVEHADSFRSRHLTQLFLNIFGSNARTASLNFRGILVLATAESTSSLHSIISNAHIFKEIIHVIPPNKDARRDILSRLVHDRLEKAKDIKEDTDSPVNFTEISTQTEGYSATDLKDLVARAIHQVAMRSNAGTPLRLTQADFSAAQKDFVPLSLSDIKLEKSDVTWSDIGGLLETRRVLRETLEWPTKYGPIFKQSPLRLRSGLLLYGFPGCGKTLLASAVAKECGLNFISVKGPEILNKYIGASEKSVRDLFERASAARPCVLFFDEFDSIAPKRGHDSTGVTDRVVNQMLTQMDGAEGLEGVYVLAATSRPDLIDSALLRPGRLDKALFCNMPELEEREDILKAVSRKISVSHLVNYNEIASKTEGFSGADLQALLYNAHLDAIHASAAGQALSSSYSDRGDDDIPLEYTIIGNSSAKLKVSKAEEMALQRRLRQILSKPDPIKYRSATAKGFPPKKPEIDQTDILKALESTRPSVSLEERQRLGKIYKTFASDRSGDLPIPPEAEGIGSRATLG